METCKNYNYPTYIYVCISSQQMKGTFPHPKQLRCFPKEQKSQLQLLPSNAILCPGRTILNKTNEMIEAQFASVIYIWTEIMAIWKCHIHAVDFAICLNVLHCLL